MKRAWLQLVLPTLADDLLRRPAPDAIVEVVIDDTGKRLRVRPVDFEGWVKFPRRLRVPGARYKVELLKPRPGGAWTATGRIRKYGRRRA